MNEMPSYIGFTRNTDNAQHKMFFPEPVTAKGEEKEDGELLLGFKNPHKVETNIDELTAYTGAKGLGAKPGLGAYAEPQEEIGLA